MIPLQEAKQVLHERVVACLQNDQVDVTQSSKMESIIINEINNCLLYTSPSPRDRTRSRMPSSA